MWDSCGDARSSVAALVTTMGINDDESDAYDSTNPLGLDMPRPPSDVLMTPGGGEGGPTILLTRVPVRTRALFRPLIHFDHHSATSSFYLRLSLQYRLELETAARRCDLAVGELQECPSGQGAVWSLSGSPDGDTRRQAFLELATSLSAVRRRLRPICCASSITEILAKLGSLRLRTTSWSLTVESMVPGTDENTVPWVVQSDVPAIAIGIAKALPNGLESFTEGEDAKVSTTPSRPSDCVPLSLPN